MVTALAMTAFCCGLIVIAMLAVFAFRVHLDIQVKGSQQMMQLCLPYDEDAPGAWSRDKYVFMTMCGVLAAACVNGVFIIVFNEIYARLAIRLTEWENHRTQAEYDASLIVKTFSFKFVNSYAACFYVAFVRKTQPTLFNMDHMDTCPNSNLYAREITCDCFYDLTVQLAAQFFARDVLERIFNYYYPVVRLAISSFLSRKPRGSSAAQLEKKAHQEKKPAEMDAADHLMGAAHIERETNLEQSEGVISEYMEIAMQFGYVSLFASVAPWLIVFAACINGLDMRADARKMLYLTRRMPDEEARGIGIWYSIFEVIVFASILNNSFMIAFTSDLFTDNGASDVSWVLTVPERWALAVVIEHALLGIKLLLAWVVPDVPTWVHATHAFQGYVCDMAMGQRAVKGIAELAKAIDEGYRAHTPHEYVTSHSGRHTARTAGEFAGLDGAQLTAGCNALDDRWEHPAGCDEAKPNTFEQPGKVAKPITFEQAAKGAKPMKKGGLGVRRAYKPEAASGAAAAATTMATSSAPATTATTTAGTTTTTTTTTSCKTSCKTSRKSSCKSSAC